VAIVPSSFALPDPELLRWAQRSAQEVGTYFAGFPVPRLALFIAPMRGGGIGLGTTMGHGGAAIVVYLGRDADAQDLEDDWVLPHEMIHLAMSPLARRHRWLKEGIATYVEPIARARVGREKVEEVWDTFIARMPDGLPGWRDRGLDHTGSWGRVYWGGALFCLVADVTIRERSGNRRSLDDALRAITRAGGHIANSWELEQLLEAGDRGTGLTVLTDLYTSWAHQKVAFDLPALWRRLGVSVRGGRVLFDDKAELAALRRSITAAPPPQ
jgi:hypothetical protein